MIYDSNMTVEEIIGQSLKNAKQLNQQKRRKWVRRMLNYYGGNSTHNYIQDYFSADAFKENAIRQHGSVEAYRKALMTNQESFSFKGNFYMTKFAKELLIHNNLKNGKNEKSNDGNPR